ncbi:MAG: NADPH-dependent F420 reductase [Acidimicrobiales bacterium]
MTTFGIVGGTGPAGRGLAARLGAAGHGVVIGSRDAQRAALVAAALGSPLIAGGSNADAAGADVVVVATPWESAVATVSALAEQLTGKVVISMVNAMAREGRELVPIYPPRGSMTAEVAAALPNATVVGAFHHLPAAQMEDLNSGLDADVIVVGDDPAALDLVAGMISGLPGLRGVAAGSLALAGAVEAFTAVCVSVNIRHRAHSYVRLAGL